MKTKLLTLCTILFMLAHVQAQVTGCQWARSSGGSAFDFLTGISTDPNGNAVIAGFFQSKTMQLGSTTLVNADSSGFRSDIFIASYNPAGNLLWANRAGSADREEITRVCTDASGNVLVSGSFYGAVFPIGTVTLTNNNMQGSGSDAFVAKYSASGVFLWAIAIGGNYADNGGGIAADLSGNVFVSGYFNSSILPVGTVTLSNTGAASGRDVFVAKLNSSGAVLWARQMGGSGSEFSYNMCADLAGNACVSGFFDSPAMSIGNSNLTNGSSATNVFIAKYDGSGNALWARQSVIQNNMTANSRGLTTDLSGNIFMTGNFASPAVAFGTTTLTGTPYNQDIFVVKYNSSGTVLWAKSAGGINTDNSEEVSSDASGNIFMTGNFSSPALSFGATTLNCSVSPTATASSMFIAKYDASGNALWAQANPTSGYASGQGTCVDGSGNLYVGGNFNSSILAFDSSTLTSGSDGDVFVAKLSGNGPVTGMKEETIQAALYVFPNPCSLQFFVRTDFIMDHASITLSDCFGNTVQQTGNLSGQEVRMSRNDLPAGIYFMTLAQGNKTMAHQKIIITD